MLAVEDFGLAFDFDLAMAAIHRAERDSHALSAAENGDATVGILKAKLYE